MFEGDQSHSEGTKEELPMLENINIDEINKFEPDNSPAGTAEQRLEFFKTIDNVLKKE